MIWLADQQSGSGLTLRPGLFYAAGVIAVLRSFFIRRPVPLTGPKDRRSAGGPEVRL